jgi:predicted GIY-YIG superfamily endonuclease
MSLKKRYVGSTKDVESRVAQHNAGKNRFTKGGIPWTVLHVEGFGSLSLARKREAFLKTGKGRAWLDENYPVAGKSKEL